MLEWVLLALVGLPVVSARRIDRYTVTHVLVWLHLALTSIRNAPLFALAAAPALATLLDGLPLAMRKSWKRDDRSVDLAVGGDAQRALAARERRQPGRLQPQKMAVCRARHPQSSTDRRTTLSRTGLGRPDRGRVPAGPADVPRRPIRDFGKEAILEYVDVLSGGPVWDTVRDRDKIEMVWLRPDRGLAKRLLKEPGWEVLYRDKVSILFRHGPASRLTAR